MGFGFSNTSSITIGTNSPKEREHLFQFGFWAPKRKLFVAYDFIGDAKPPKNVRIGIKMPQFNNLPLAIIYTISTVVWIYNYQQEPSFLLQGTSIFFLLFAAHFWGKHIGDIKNAKSKKAPKA